MLSIHRAIGVAHRSRRRRRCRRRRRRRHHNLRLAHDARITMGVDSENVCVRVCTHALSYTHTYTHSHTDTSQQTRNLNKCQARLTHSPKFMWTDYMSQPVRVRVRVCAPAKVAG